MDDKSPPVPLDETPSTLDKHNNRSYNELESDEDNDQNEDNDINLDTLVLQASTGQHQEPHCEPFEADDGFQLIKRRTRAYHKTNYAKPIQSRHYYTSKLYTNNRGRTVEPGVTFERPPGLFQNDSNKSDSPDCIGHGDGNSRWETASQVYNKKILRQSAYVVGVIPERVFIAKGGKLLNYGIYFIEREFNGTPENETVALLGIPMIHVQNFFVEESDLIKEIRKEPQLQYIDNINELCCTSTCDILRKFRRFFENCESDHLLLLNIEPRGEGKYKRLYPYPRFTLPGGTMEKVDCNDFIQCAIREFKEETSLDIHDNYELVSQKKIMKDIRTKRKNINNYFNSTCKPTKVVSIYYAMRIRH